jgi:hypothetical protein
VRTGGLKSGPFAAGAINYYRSTFAVKCFLEIQRWSLLLAVNQAGGQQNFTFDSAPQNSTNTAALLADEESDEAEAESPDRLLPSLIRCS